MYDLHSMPLPHPSRASNETTDTFYNQRISSPQEFDFPAYLPPDKKKQRKNQIYKALPENSPVTPSAGCYGDPGKAIGKYLPEFVFAISQ